MRKQYLKKSAKLFLITSFLIFFIISKSNAQSNIKRITKTFNVNSTTECEAKNGYWYKNKCWAYFNEMDDGISKQDIDSVATAQFDIIEKTKIILNKDAYEIKSFFPEEEDDEYTLLFIFEKDNVEKTLLVNVNKKQLEKKKNFEVEAMIFNVNLAKESEKGELSEYKMTSLMEIGGSPTANVINKDKFQIELKGDLVDLKTNKNYKFSLNMNEAIMGAGGSTVTVKNNKAFINGELGTKTYVQLKNLIANHPTIKTLVLEQVPGSLNDAVNMHTGRLLRENNFTTELTSSSIIASGGVDLFCAGVKRIYTEGAQLGIHSWGGMGISANDLSKDHPAHQYQIAYFTMCLGENLGPEFYFHTLSAAKFDDIHWMSLEEMKKYNVATTYNKRVQKTEVVSTNNLLLGEWKIKTIAFGSMELPAEEAIGSSEIYQFYLENGDFKENALGEVSTGSWKKEGNNLTITTKKETNVYSVEEISKNTLKYSRIDDTGQKVVFTFIRR